MNIVFFDFDGTITKKDSLIGFIKYSKGTFNFYLGIIILSPILILYKLKVIPNYIAKEKLISYFFSKMTEAEFRKVFISYSLNNIQNILRIRKNYQSYLKKN